MSVKTESPAEFLLATARRDGVACSSVKDGHVLVFSKAKLEELVNSCGSAEEIIVFIKRTDFTS